MNIKDFLAKKECELIALKELCELFDYIVKIDLKDRKATLDTIIKNDEMCISLFALVWNKKDFLPYKRYKAQICIKTKEIKKYSKKEIRNILLCDIYRQVIKNNIMML